MRLQTRGWARPRHAPAYLLACIPLLRPAALGGGSGEAALLVVDPASAEALYVANHYKAARGIPDVNVLYMDPRATSYPTFVAGAQQGFFGTLAGRRIEHVDYVIVMPGTSFFVSAPGLVSDGCSPVNRFSVAAPYTLAYQSSKILGGTAVSILNQYFSTGDQALAFDSDVAWMGGQPSSLPSAERYFIGAMLGYTGLRGNTVAELLELIDRSVAVDGTHPAGTFYFLETTDFVRSSPRHGFYPAVTAAIGALGGQAQHLLADMPVGLHDCQGIMTGLANPLVAGGNFTVLPGAFCDHLTSFAGTFDVGSQTKMSEWITQGASGTAGTVEEPCNYPGKFPHARMHLYYFQGLSLGEAWLRSMRFYPYQNLLYGDPLTRPWATIPSVDLPDVPAGPVSGTVYLTPVAATVPPLAVQDLELYVDGVLTRRGTLGDTLPLQTQLLADGWHELRVLAYDDASVRNVGRWVGSVTVDNGGASAAVAVSAPSGDLGSVFDFDVSAAGGGVAELRLVSSGRVLGATSANPGTIRVFGQNLGAGPVRVQAEARFASGALVKSPPLELDVAFTGGGAGGAAPVAFAFEKRVRADVASVVELPAAFADDPADAVFSIVTAPAQASLVPGAASAFRILIPAPGASGVDGLTFRVTTPSGDSADALVTLVYEPAFDCPPPATYCQSAPNSNGPGAFIAFHGSTSIAANAAELSVYGASVSQIGIFYYGPTQIRIPFGDGFRCVGGGSLGTYRLPLVQSDLFGDLDHALDLNAPPMGSGPGEIHPGATWNFQYWYRDPFGPGGSTFNFSDAVSVSFCP